MAERLRVGDDIAARLLAFGVAVVQIAGRLPKDTAGHHVALQLVRSGTGGGSNYEEARGAESRDDFIHKLGIATKEVRETIYWLQFIQRSDWMDVDLRALIREGHELAAILSASARTARSTRPKPRRR